MQKICCICGQDVAAQPRTKDDAGRYYCNPCYSANQSKPHKLRTRFVCPNCNGEFGESGMDESGLCKLCATPPTNSTSTCSGCGDPIRNDAAFCQKCGSKGNTGISVDEQIEYSDAVHLLSMYAEAAGRQFMKDRQGIGVDENAVGVISRVRSSLVKIDYQRLLSVRDSILRHDSVPELAKTGLRIDPAGIFSRPQQQRQVALGNVSAVERPAKSSQGSSALSTSFGKVMVTAIGMTVVVLGIRLILDEAASYFALAAVALLFPIRVLQLWAGQCPSCRIWGALEARPDRPPEFLGQTLGTVDRIQTDFHRDMSGRICGTTDRVVQDVVARQSYLCHYRCIHCSATCTMVRRKPDPSPKR